jgi:hypothetical protein
MASLGFGHVIVSPRGPWTDDNLHALTEILPDIHAIDPLRCAGRRESRWLVV